MYPDVGHERLKESEEWKQLKNVSSEWYKDA
jgi:hypothetical protein